MTIQFEYQVIEPCQDPSHQLICRRHKARTVGLRHECKTRMQDSNASEETSGWQGFKHLSEVNERTEDEARHADG